VLTGHRDAVTTLAFGPDGRVLVSGARDGVALLWAVPDPTRLGSAGVPAPRRWWRRRRAARAVAVSRNGRLLAIGGDPVRIWDVSDPAHPVPAAVLSYPGRSRIGGHAIGFSPDDRLLAVGDTDSTYLWQVADPARPVPGARLRTYRWGFRSPINAVAFSPDGGLLAADGGHTIALFDVREPALPALVSRSRTFPKSAYSAAATWSLAFRPGGGLLASASYSLNAGQYGSSQQSAVLIWDLSDPARPARTAALVDRGRRWPAPPAGTTTVEGHLGEARAVGFSPDGRWLVSGGDDRTALLWDLADPAQPRPTVSFTHSSPVRAVAFSPDGRLLATGAGPTVALWEITPAVGPG